MPIPIQEWIKSTVYGKEIGVIPLKQGEKETMDLPYNSHHNLRTSEIK